MRLTRRLGRRRVLVKMCKEIKVNKIYSSPAQGLQQTWQFISLFFPTGLRKETGNAFSVELAPPPLLPLRLPGHRASFEYLNNLLPLVMRVGRRAPQVHDGAWNAIADVQKSERSERRRGLPRLKHVECSLGKRK